MHSQSQRSRPNRTQRNHAPHRARVSQADSRTKVFLLLLLFWFFPFLILLLLNILISCWNFALHYQEFTCPPTRTEFDPLSPTSFRQVLVILEWSPLRVVSLFRSTCRLCDHTNVEAIPVEDMERKTFVLSSQAYLSLVLFKPLRWFCVIVLCWISSRPIQYLPRPRSH